MLLYRSWGQCLVLRCAAVTESKRITMQAAAYMSKSSSSTDAPCAVSSISSGTKP